MNGAKFTQVNGALSMTCTVVVNMRASAEIAWAILTDTKGFPGWNSTVTGIEGEIREGGRLRLHVPGTKRIFTPRVSGVVPGRRMVWSDGVAGIFRGVRTFVLEPRSDASTDFTMEERFSGVVFALVKGMFPDFRPIFEAYANDLKREAQSRAATFGSDNHNREG